MTEEFTDLESPDWLALFERVEESWFRLETLQVYTVGYEQAEFDGFLRTGRLDRPPGAWQQMLARHASVGKRLRRVHVVEEPLTDYLRYELAAYRRNAEAGEEIRLIAVSPPAWPDGLPRGIDYWLLDDREIWNMHYDSEGRFLRAVRSESADHLEQCRRWRDLTLEQSVSLVHYLRTAT
ncbi:MAG: DUF6879 family protein [Nocardioides sp.]